jgi:TonB family protein
VARQFARPGTSPFFRTAVDYPPDLIASVARATGCNVSKVGEKGGGAAEVTLRADGRVAHVGVIDTKLPRECAEAALALFAIYAAHLPPPASEGERRLLMLPLLRTDPACHVDPAAVQPLPQSAGPVKGPQKTRDAKPVYPKSAQSDRVSGIVIVETVVSPAGCVASARVVRGVDPRLDWAALVAVLQWRFTPMVIGTTPRAVVMTVTVNFTLN